MSLFRDRVDAGRQLGRAVRNRLGPAGGAVVLALLCGGVPVGYEVARAIAAPLDVLLVRKLGVPGGEELAMGAIASGGVRVVNQHVMQMYAISLEAMGRVVAAEMRELERRERAYRGDRGCAEVGGRTAILVDDGLATGASMRAAVTAVRAEKPAQIVVAVPTAARDTAELVAAEADDFVCLATPEPFFAVGASYDQFAQTSDEEVRSLLDRAAAMLRADAPPAMEGA